MANATVEASRECRVCSFMGIRHGCGDRTISWGGLIVPGAGIADKVGRQPGIPAQVSVTCSGQIARICGSCGRQHRLDSRGNLQTQPATTKLFKARGSNAGGHAPGSHVRQRTKPRLISSMIESFKGNGAGVTSHVLPNAYFQVSRLVRFTHVVSMTDPETACFKYFRPIQSQRPAGGRPFGN